MKAAFAVWNKRIAPVFDVAREIRLIETEFGHVVCERDESLPADSGPEKGRRLSELGIETLICGAISRFMLSLVEAYSIQVISFVAGDLKEVMQAWLSNDFHREAFAMPGCGRRDHRLSRTIQLNQMDSRTPKQHRDCNSEHARKGFGHACSVRQNKERIMKVAISCEEPDLDSRIDPRFGRAAGFCIVDPETLEFSYIDNGSSQSLSQGAGIQAAENVCRSGASVVLTGYVGPKAFQALSAAGIKIGQNLTDMTVRQAIDKYKAGVVDMADAPNRMGHGK